MVGAIVIGVVAGVVAWVLVPVDAFLGMSGPVSLTVSIGLGLAGAVLGSVVFTASTGTGDGSVLDLSGISGAIIGTIIVVPIATSVLRKRNDSDRPRTGRP